MVCFAQLESIRPRGSALAPQFISPEVERHFDQLNRLPHWFVLGGLPGEDPSRLSAVASGLLGGVKPPLNSAEERTIGELLLDILEIDHLVQGGGEAKTTATPTWTRTRKRS